MRLRTLAGVALVLATAGSARAGFFDLALNDDSFDTRLGFHIGDNSEARFVAGGRFLYDDDVESRVPSVFCGYASKPDAVEGMDFWVGLQYTNGETADNVDVEGFGIGGDVTWAPRNWKGAFVGARLFYTPSVFATGDTEDMFDWAALGGYRINEKIDVFLEYSQFKTEVEGRGDFDVDDGLKVGVAIRWGK